jgi:DNA (cytosine-5)-methyltransferase 1
MLRVMDLFSGIGGFSLGLKRAGGFRTVAYCEIDPYCRQILQARMHDGSLDPAPICTDVRALDGEPWGGAVDVVCGGFPCQDISGAGLKAGIDGERSGLWAHMHRIICEVRPRIVFVENVSALLARGFERVLGDLASSGYDAEWDVIPACALGAEHLRERVWIVAYPDSEGELQPQGGVQQERGRPGDGGKAVAHAERLGRSEVEPEDGGGAHRSGASGTALQRRVFRGRVEGRWEPEPGVGRVADGVPDRVDRITALGNAVVPQVVEWIGRRIVEMNKS